MNHIIFKEGDDVELTVENDNTDFYTLWINLRNDADIDIRGVSSEQLEAIAVRILRIVGTNDLDIMNKYNLHVSTLGIRPLEV